jgi:hypothetical protein
MSQPTASQVHTDSILTNMSVGYFQARENFVGLQAFGGPIPVAKKSDKYYKYAKDAFLRDEMQRRAPASESAGSGYGVSTDNYACDVFALHKDIPDEDRQNSDSPLDPDADAVEFLNQKAMLNLEVSWASAFFATGKWATDVTPGVVWSTYATSDPIVDVRTGKKTVLAATGFEPNVLVLGFEVYNILTEHPDFIERIKYTNSDAVTAAIMARLFDVERVLVCKSVKATAEENAGSQTYGFVHGKHALLAYVRPQPNIRSITAGGTFLWSGISNGLGQTVNINRERVPLKKADRLEIEVAYTHKVIASDLGYFFNGAVA